MNFMRCLHLGFYIFVGLLCSLSGHTQQRYCYSGAEVKTKAGATELVFQKDSLSPSEVVRFTVRPLVNRYAYLVTDQNDQIIKVSRTNFVEIGDLPVGNYRVWAFSYIGRLTVQPGDFAVSGQLASFCSQLSGNFVSLSINGATSPPAFTLQILHHSDGESALINAGENFPDVGGVARFKTIIDEQRVRAQAIGATSLLISAGDNILAGPEFTAGLRQPPGTPVFDAIAQSLFGYDAMALGNHEFDFGPDILHKYIREFNPETAPPFLSANLSFVNEPLLQGLADFDRIKRHTIVEKDGEKIGIIGLTTPDLAFVSNPGQTEVGTDLVGILQAEVDQLEADGINKIILVSHLQSLDNEIELVGQVNGVDMVIAGGGDEFLSNQPLVDAIPGLIDSVNVRGAYPLVVSDAVGNNVYVVTAPGGYTYLGNLTVAFSEDGKVMDILPESGPIKIITDTLDEEIKAQVTQPVEAFLSSLSTNIIGITEIELNGRRADVRSIETNMGNLVADALLWEANLLAPAFGEAPADIAIQNGGGIRNSVVVPAGEFISELTTFNVLPFPNFVTIVDAISPAQLKQIMERAVSQVESFSGQFAQIAGFNIVYDPNATPQTVDENGNITQSGDRVVSIRLDDGTIIVENGQVNEEARAIRVATIDFLARGGDAYPFAGASFTSIGVTYQQALFTYITVALRGAVSGAQYPVGGSGRIQQLGSPTPLGRQPFLPTVNDTPLQVKVFQQRQFPEWTLEMDLASPGMAKGQLYDGLGRLLSTWDWGHQPKGFFQTKIAMNQIGKTNGAYFLAVQVGKQTKVLPIVHVLESH